MIYSIRQATPLDLDSLVHLGRRFFEAAHYQEYLEYDPESVRGTMTNLIESDLGSLLVVEAGESVVGMLGALLYPFYFNQSHLTGQELFWWVDAGYRDSGAGMALLEMTEAWAKQNGAETFSMVSLESSAPAKIGELYRSLGYRPSEYGYIKRVS